MLPQHRDECSKQGHQKTRVHETGDGDDLARRTFLDRRNGRGFTGDGGLIESEEDGAEGSGLVIWIWLEVRMDIDDESGADGGEQTGL